MVIKQTYYTKFRKSNKYNAKKTIVDDITFDSKWEAERYGQLKSMESARIVTNLNLQVPFDLNVNGQKICKYIADFTYTIRNIDNTSEEIVEDAKGIETPEFKLKKKLMKAIHNIDIYMSKKRVWQIL